MPEKISLVSLLLTLNRYFSTCQRTNTSSNSANRGKTDVVPGSFKDFKDVSDLSLLLLLQLLTIFTHDPTLWVQDIN